MDGWNDGLMSWLDGSMETELHGWMDGSMGADEYGWVHRRMASCMDTAIHDYLIHGWIDECMAG